MRRTTILATLLAALTTSGCVVEQRKLLGDQCELSSECDAPLICRLGRCRNECVGSRDCGLGLRCVRAQDGLGVCLLPDESECERTSDCPEPLVCIDQSCINECAEDRDCPAGGRCVEEDGARVCVELATERCVYDSSCPFPLVCTDGQCVAECRDAQDCELPGQACVAHPTCRGEPCMCRFECGGAGDCPNPGTVCVGAGPDGGAGYCERESYADAGVGG
ncbi:MAG TPA: hypothetical protein RMH99_29520 [Sandaracinaceae bacterium LLY-WYZ-13_1]|nr:hypothetical protein [Sandaracinaceae bacterium LLY-WYZ-13_1]